MSQISGKAGYRTNDGPSSGRHSQLNKATLYGGDAEDNQTSRVTASQLPT